MASTRRAPCERCGGLTASPYGVCDRRRQPGCHAEYERRRRYARELGRIPDEWPEPRQCQCCDAPIDSDNKYGFCQQNPECEKERNRLKGVAWYHGNLAVARERLRSDRHREVSRRWAAKDRAANPGKRAEIAKRFLQRDDRPCRVAKCEEFAMVGQRECRQHKQESSRIWRQEQRRGTTSKLAERQDWMCTWCGVRLPEDLADCEIDHIIPKSITLIEEDWNKALLHWWCNAEKWNYITPEALDLALEHGVDLGSRYVVASPPFELVAAANGHGGKPGPLVRADQ
jgi:HNH endonuclease